MNTREIFKNNLNKFIEQSGKNKKMISAEMNIPYTTLAEWANGNKFPRADGIERLANYFKILKSDLLEEPKSDKSNSSNDDPIDDKINSAFNVLDNKYLRQIPVYESVSAGFGAYADNTILEYMPLYIRCDYEAENTLCIKVVGDSMYPKIEDGDIIQVEKQESVDSGQIAVVLLDGDEGFVKKVIYGADWIELHSFNPAYKTMRFTGADVQRISVVGLVKKVIKSFV